MQNQAAPDRAGRSVIPVVLTIVALHFSIFSLGGGLSLTPALLGSLYVWRRWMTGRIPLKSLVALLFLMAIPLATYIASAAGLVTAGHFFRSYAQYVLALAVVIVATSRPLRPGIHRELEHAGTWALAIVSSYSAAQYVLYRFAHSAVLYDPWRGHQYLYQYDPTRYGTAVRAAGFYLEPSFNALVLCVTFAIACSSGVRAWPTLFAIIGLACTNSISGYVGFSILLVGKILSSSPLTTLGKRVALLSAAIVATLSAILFTNIPSYIWARISSGNSAGTSTHYRITGPLPIVIDRLSSGVGGLPLGSVQSVVPRYSLYLGDELGSSLDNGIYLLVFYFGWLGILGLGLWLLWSFRNRARFVQFLFIVSLLAFTGAIFSPEFALLVGLLVVAWRAGTMRAGSQ